MTNTLHRVQKHDAPKDDYVVFALATPGVNDERYVENTRKFLATALKYNPINASGATKYGPMYRPEKNLTPYKLYFKGRKEFVTPEQLLQEINYPGMVMVVFAHKDNLEGFLKEIRQLDLGLSINVSSPVDDIREMIDRTGVKPHSINYALGFRGDLYLLPERQVLELTSLCGHGLISSNFAKKMIELVQEKRVTPEKAAGYMAKFCVCGAFNTSRAVRILKEGGKLPPPDKD